VIKKLVLSLLLAGTLLLAFAASDKDLEQNLVSMDEATVLNEAVQILEHFSLKFAGKKMINQSNFNGNIGIPVNSLPWRQAAEMVALRNNLLLAELPGYLAFVNPGSKEEIRATAADILGVNQKQVRINAIALLADRAYLKSLGVDWSTLIDGKVKITGVFSGGALVPDPIVGVGASRSFSVDGYPVELSALLSTIESNQKGSVIAKPNIIVSSGKKGFIQVGQDISVKAIDDAGNTTETFYATGMMMDVVPTVVEVDGQELVHLKVSIERSSGTPGNISTIIDKSKSETELVLYDGEEAVMGGLYDTDKTIQRSGIPFLKDLPWWVLGIRYLTGYDKEQIRERELVIILKTDIVENAYERALKAANNPLRTKVPADVGSWGYEEE